MQWSTIAALLLFCLVASSLVVAELRPHTHGEFFAVMMSGATLKVSRDHRDGLAAAMKRQAV